MYAQQRTFASSSPDTSLCTLFDVLFSTFVDCWQQEKEEQRRAGRGGGTAVQIRGEGGDAAHRWSSRTSSHGRSCIPDFRGDWADIEVPERVVMDEEEEAREIALRRRRRRWNESVLPKASISAMHLSP